MVNQAIEDAKAFLPEDAYLKTVTKFEPAGYNPEYRDAAGPWWHLFRHTL